MPVKLIQRIFPRYNERLALSLAGVIQAASLADALANTGSCDLKSFERCLLALLKTSPEKEADVFGDYQETKYQDMQIGIKELIQFCNGANQNQATIRYAIQVLHLQKLLGKKPDIQQKIQSGLAHAEKQLHMYGIDSDNLVLNLADLYQASISTLGFRIQITGKQHFLQQDMIAARIRLLLFAAVRFAFLWRQSGGHALHLVTARKTIGNYAHKLTN